MRRHAGDEPVAVVDVRARDNPIAALLGHARAAETATPQQLQRARWIISPVRDDDHASLAVTVSQPVPISGDTTRRLGLYRVGP